MTTPKCFEVLVSQWHVGTLLKWNNLEALDTEIDININDNVHVEFWHEPHSTIDNFHDEDEFNDEYVNHVYVMYTPSNASEEQVKMAYILEIRKNY